MAKTEEFYKLEERQASGSVSPDLERALIILRQSGVDLLAFRAAKELAVLRAALEEARAAMEAGDVLDAIDKWLAKYPEGESG